MLRKRVFLRSTSDLGRRAFAIFSAHRPISNESTFELEAVFPTELVKSFMEDGACVVRGAFDSKVVESLRAATERNLATPGPLCDEHADAQGRTGRFHDDQFLWTRHPEAAKFVL